MENKFSERLRFLREKAEMKQVDMCKIFNMPKTTYNSYELGTREPDFDTALKIADYFNVSIDYLFGKSDTSNYQKYKNDEMHKPNKKFSLRMKEFRQKHNFTQLYLAEIIGTTKEVIDNYENGSTAPDIAIIEKLSRIFNLSSDYLLGLTDKPNEIVTHRIEARDLPDNDIYKELKEYIESINLPIGKNLEDYTYSDMKKILEIAKKITEKIT